MRTTVAVLVCLVIIIQTSLAQRRKREPSLCDGAKLRVGVGHNPHPTDSTQFIQCYYMNSGKVEPVFRSCEYGNFWDQTKIRCWPSKNVNSKKDKCKTGLLKYYKHSNPNQCGAYFQCIGGLSHGKCCDAGFGFHPARGCVRNDKCKDMCPFDDRVPGCTKRPVSGSPTIYDQYTDNGMWRRIDCPPGRAFSPTDCGCTIKGVVVAGKTCYPDLKLNFDNGLKDTSGKNTQVINRNVRVYNGAAFFNSRASLTIKPFPALPGDDNNIVIKFRYQDDPRYASRQGSTAVPLVTNGHCGKPSSIYIGKDKKNIILGANTQLNMTTKLELPIVQGKKWKEVLYIHDGFTLEGRVCGAAGGDWAEGKLIDSSCGLQFGSAKGMRGFAGLIDDIVVYRCKPIDEVLTINY